LKNPEHFCSINRTYKLQMPRKNGPVLGGYGRTNLSRIPSGVKRWPKRNSMPTAFRTWSKGALSSSVNTVRSKWDLKINLHRLFSGMRAEGIYRVNGNTAKVDKLMKRFKSPEKLQMKFPKFDEFDVASALKKFIRDLPASLFGDLINDFLKVNRK
jgi:RhoGAP domain